MALNVACQFPGANVRVLDVVQAPDAEIVFTPDPHGGPETMWFYFRLEDADRVEPAPEHLTLTLRFFGNMLGGGRPGDHVRPAWRIEGKPWNRLPSPRIERLKDGQSVLRWHIPYPLAPTEIALSHPYLPDELRGLLHRSKGYWHEEPIGLTQQSRLLTRLDNRRSLASVSTQPRGLYLLARQHAGETPGSWVLDGLLDGISRRKSGAPWRVWAVPFVDLDGVMCGNYGKDAFPYDLNRAWGNPPMRHETLVLQRDMRRWKMLCKPELVIDLHAPSVCEHDGAYVYMKDGVTDALDRSIKAWANIFQQVLTPDFAAENFIRKASYPSRWDTPSVGSFAQESLGCAALSMEVPYAMCGSTVMTPRQYREIGRRLAKAIMNRW